MTTNTKSKRLYLAGLFLGLAILLTTPSWADSSYSFPRVVEGPSSVIGANGDRESVEAHMPLLVGDRLWVPYDSRLEVVLSDRSLLRIEGDARIDFKSIAYSTDTDDRTTELHLTDGEVQLIVPEDFLGDFLPVVVTPDATIYIDEPGTFRITISRDGWTELVVREGHAEITDDRESSAVRPGEMAVVEGGRRPYFGIRLAGRHDSLERWGDRLTREASYASLDYVDRSLHYVAAPLVHHGVWVSIGGRHGWRPRVAATWRPYSHGYWRTTPAGLTWVSRDPWGHVTHHYGSWDYGPGYGWVWYPGRVYSTARVHWYWGPDYVGWCPSGYYASYYGGRHGYGHGSGVGFGIYGWAGGSWSHFSHWNFTASIHFGRRDQHHHVYSGRTMATHRTGVALERGIITTDPGFVGHKKPGEVMTRLRGEIEDYRRTTGRDVPDVSSYVARKPLTDDLREAIRKPKPLTRPSKPSIVVEKFPGSSGSKPDVGARITTSKPRDRTPRVDTRTELEAPRVDGKPATKPYRPEPTYKRPTVKPRTGDDKRPTIRLSPRDVDQDRKTPRVTRPRVESAKPTPPRVERYKAPTVTKPRVTTPRPTTPRVTTPRVTKPRTTTPRVTTPRATTPRVTTPRVTKPRVESSKPSPSKPTVKATPSKPSKPKPSVKSSDGKSSRSSKGSKSSGTAKKPRKKKDN